MLSQAARSAAIVKQLVFVDDDPCVLHAWEHQFHAMRQEWNMRFVRSSTDALACLAHGPVDFIVTDADMPVLDGAQLLALVAKLYPHTGRLIVSGQADRDAVLRLVGPAHQYLSKPCELKELRPALARAQSVAHLLADGALKNLVGEFRFLPALPEQHHPLTAEFLKEQPSIERIGELISRDVALTSQILPLVNSPCFALPHRVVTPLEAASVLGLPTMRALVFSVHLFSQFGIRAPRNLSVEQLSAQSWRAGQAARNIALSQHEGGKVPEQSFLAGVLHDVGQLMLAIEMPRRYAEVLRAARASQHPIWQAERDEFGTTHAEVGAWLFHSWGLPGAVVEAVALHHRPADCVTRGFSPAIAVHIADVLIHQHRAAADGINGYEVDLPALAALGLQDRLSSWKEQFAKAA